VRGGNSRRGDAWLLMLRLEILFSVVCGVYYRISRLGFAWRRRVDVRESVVQRVLSVGYWVLRG